MTHPRIIHKNTNIACRRNFLDGGKILFSEGIRAQVNVYHAYIAFRELGVDFGLCFLEFGERARDEDEIEAAFCELEGERFSDSGGGACDNGVSGTITFAELVDLS